MKALQLRSPINLFYSRTTNKEFTNLDISIHINDDVTAIDTTTTPDYSLSTEAINETVSTEIAELIRSKNDYLYKTDFYTTRDTATYVLIKAILKKANGDALRTQYNFFKARDGYVDRNEVQLLYSEVTPIITGWNKNPTGTITATQADPFGGTDAYLLNDSSTNQKYIFNDDIALTGVYTMSCFLKGTTIVEVGKNSTNKISVNLGSGLVVSTTGTVIAYDVFKVGTWYKISVTQTMTSTDDFRIAERLPATASAGIYIFNPTIIKGKLINFEPTEVLLQTNTTNFNVTGGQAVGNIFDRKESIAYNLNVGGFNPAFDLSGRFIAFPLERSYVAIDPFVSFFLISQTQLLTRVIPCEPKYTPVRTGFINKFGVRQELIFFKRRDDSFNTQQEDFKANILRNGTYLPHVGQKQVISKTASAEVKVNTGFYPEDFNEVFKQLQYSLNHWIDNEPAVLKGSNFGIKTNVNDKLINYSFDFEYANPDINDIR
jgi:hypothetical protein